jgi:hypothetical protein
MVVYIPSLDYSLEIIQLILDHYLERADYDNIGATIVLVALHAPRR